MPLYDWKCPEGHTTEAIRRSDCVGIACPRCDLTASRQFASRVAIVGPTTDTRNMFRRYQEASAEIGHTADTLAAATGRDVEMPNLWQEAKQRAAAMTAAGENPYTAQSGALSQ